MRPKSVVYTDEAEVFKKLKEIGICKRDFLTLNTSLVVFKKIFMLGILKFNKKLMLRFKAGNCVILNTEFIF